jgi:predicted DNA-binding transcriptional regulator AlpA
MTAPLPEMPRPVDMAALLDCSLSKVGRLRRAGELPPSFTVGRARYWRKADVLAWLDTRVASATTEQEAA